MWTAPISSSSAMTAVRASSLPASSSSSSLRSPHRRALSSRQRAQPARPARPPPLAHTLILVLVNALLLIAALATIAIPSSHMPQLHSHALIIHYNHTSTSSLASDVAPTPTSASTSLLIYHLTAQYGPPTGTYTVSAPLLHTAPSHLCLPSVPVRTASDDISASDHAVHPIDAESMLVSNVRELGTVILIAERGGCSFLDKASAAQRLGASALIVANVPPFDDILVSMANDSAEAMSITIPVVFILHRDYVNILRAWSAVRPHSAVRASAHGDDDSDSDSNSDSGSDGDSDTMSRQYQQLSSFSSPRALLATLDARGDSGRLDLVSIIPVLATLLLSIPFAVGLLGVVYVLDLFLLDSSRRLQRRLISSALPVIPYRALPLVTPASSNNLHPLPSSSSSTSSSSSSDASLAGMGMLNSSCAICLDDFTDGQLVKSLPCQHVYHTACILPWLDKHSSLCPLCKRSILPDDNDSTVCWQLYDLHACHVASQISRALIALPRFPRSALATLRVSLIQLHALFLLSVLRMEMTLRRLWRSHRDGIVRAAVDP